MYFRTRHGAVWKSRSRLRSISVGPLKMKRIRRTRLFILSILRIQIMARRQLQAHLTTSFFLPIRRQFSDFLNFAKKRKRNRFCRLEFRCWQSACVSGKTNSEIEKHKDVHIRQKATITFCLGRFRHIERLNLGSLVDGLAATYIDRSSIL